MTDTNVNQAKTSGLKNKHGSNPPAEQARLTLNFDLPRVKRKPLQFKIDETLVLGEGIWGIFGQSGTGKSTLLKAIAGLYKGAEYGFSLQVNKLSQTADVQYFSQLSACDNPCAYLGAESILFEHLNVADNLRLVQKLGGFSHLAKLSYQEVIALCGIQNLLTQSISRLSSGETQRVKFARALLSGKPCILLDEAFSALDWPTRQYFSGLVVKLHKEHGLGFVIVSHSLRELALSSTYISELYEGKLLHSGLASQMIEHLQLSRSTASVAALSPKTPVAAEHEEYSGDMFSLLNVKVLSNDEHAKLAACVLLDADEANTILVRAKTPLSVKQEHKLTLDADKVSLSTNKVTSTSMLNSLRGKVVGIKHYNSVVLVTVLVAAQHILAAISIRSFEQLDIKLDDEIFTLFKAL